MNLRQRNHTGGIALSEKVCELSVHGRENYFIRIRES